MTRIFALMLLWLPLFAAAVEPVQRDNSGGLEEPARMLRKGVETLSGYLANTPGYSPLQLRTFLEQEIAPYFDFRRMAYWAAGPLNRYLNPRQQAQLGEMLKDRFLQTLVVQLGSYRQSRIHYLRPRGNPQRGKVTLALQVFGFDAPPVELQFRLHRGGEGWRVYDVLANGSSAVAYYRREFAMQVRKYGMQGFLTALSSY